MKNEFAYNDDKMIKTDKLLFYSKDGISKQLLIYKYKFLCKEKEFIK